MLLFAAARKPHAYLPLIRGYMNVVHNDAKTTGVLFKVVDLGLQHEQLDYTPQFFKLLEGLLLLGDSDEHQSEAEHWLAHIVGTTIRGNCGYWLFMD